MRSSESRVGEEAPDRKRGARKSDSRIVTAARDGRGGRASRCASTGRTLNIGGSREGEVGIIIEVAVARANRDEVRRGEGPPRRPTATATPSSIATSTITIEL